MQATFPITESSGVLLVALRMATSRRKPAIIAESLKKFS
jgi:hypothetical protein